MRLFKLRPQKKQKLMPSEHYFFVEAENGVFFHAPREPWCKGINIFAAFHKNLSDDEGLESFLEISRVYRLGIDQEHISPPEKFHGNGPRGITRVRILRIRIKGRFRHPDWKCVGDEFPYHGQLVPTSVTT